MKMCYIYYKYVLFSGAYTNLSYLSGLVKF